MRIETAQAEEAARVAEAASAASSNSDEYTDEESDRSQTQNSRQTYSTSVQKFQSGLDSHRSKRHRRARKTDDDHATKQAALAIERRAREEKRERIRQTQERLKQEIAEASSLKFDLQSELGTSVKSMDVLANLEEDGQWFELSAVRMCSHHYGYNATTEHILFRTPTRSPLLKHLRAVYIHAYT